MKFAIATVKYWDSLGFNTAPWRKSLDGTKAICHLDYAEKLGGNLQANPEVKIYDSVDTEFEDLMNSPEWATEKTFGDPDSFSILNELNQFETRINDSVSTTVAETKSTIEQSQESLAQQLAQKVTKGQVSVNDVDKNKGKFDQTYMTDEFLQQMAGNAPINAVPANDSITDDKLANGVTLEKFRDVEKKLKTVNRLNPDNIVVGGYYHMTLGTWVAQEGYASSGFIPVKPNTTYWKSGVSLITFWDADKKYISGFSRSASFTTPNNEAVKYVNLSMTEDTTPFYEWMLVEGSSSPGGFVPYGEFYELNNGTYKLNDLILSDYKKQTLSRLTESDVYKLNSTTFKPVNLINPEEVETNGSYRISDGLWNGSPSDTRRSTGLIEVVPGRVYSTPHSVQLTYWAANESFLYGETKTTPFAIPRNNDIKFVRFEMTKNVLPYDQYMMVEGIEYPSEFTPYNIGKIKEIDDLDIQMESALASSPNSLGYIETVAGGETQLTHPSLVYFEEGWNGYKFWMGITPYPNSNSRLENPCILASNDLVNWDEPADGVNPLDMPPSDNPYFNSDTELFVVGDTLELWWRRRYSSTSEQFLRRTSTDGINWTPEELVFESVSGSDILSPSIFYEDNLYKMWTLNGNNGEFSYWEGATPTEFELIRKFIVGEGDAWHAQVKKNSNGEYEMYYSHGTRSQNYYISYSKSKDNIVWSEPEVVIRSVPLRYDSQLYRPSFVDIPGKLRTNTLRVIAYGMYHENNIWNTGISIAYKEAPTHLRGLNLLDGKDSKLPKEINF